MKTKNGKQKRIWIKRVLAMMAIVFFCVNGGTIVAKDRADNIMDRIAGKIISLRQIPVVIFQFWDTTKVRRMMAEAA